MKPETAMAIALRMAAKEKGVEVKDLGKPSTPEPSTQPHERKKIQLPARAGVKAS